MAKSPRLKELEERLRALRKHMLPAVFSPTGDYTDRQLDRARGYRVLAHAEIEAFLEDVTFEAAKRSVAKWEATKKVSHSLFCLIAHYHHGFGVDGYDELVPFPSDSRVKFKEAIKEIVNVAMAQYKKIHSDNNGIREKNLFRLAIPVGILKDDLDQFWITTLDEFGKKRGDVAHKAVKAQQQINPKDELQTIKDLLKGLSTLDQLVTNLSA